MEDPRSQVTRLYRELGPVVYRRCLRLLGDRAAAEDATQEVFVKLMRDMDRLKDRETVLPWIYRVATNHCLNVRRDARRRGQDGLAEDLEVVPDARADGPDAYPDRQLAQAVLSRFDAETQAVAVGVLVDGMEHEEIAAVLGISRRTVSRKLARFLENARKFIARTGTGEAESDEGAALTRCASELALEGHLLDPARSRLGSHLEGCPACQARLARMEREGRGVPPLRPPAHRRPAARRAGGPPQRAGRGSSARCSRRAGSPRPRRPMLLLVSPARPTTTWA